jgi:hypothetical protein
MVGYDKKRTKNIEPGRAEFFNRRRSRLPPPLVCFAFSESRPAEIDR